VNKCQLGFGNNFSTFSLAAALVSHSLFSSELPLLVFLIFGALDGITMYAVVPTAFTTPRTVNFRRGAGRVRCPAPFVALWIKTIQHSFATGFKPYCA
jgi:hypothetical protein